MLVELLYFEGCPNWQITQRDIERTLTEQKVDASVKLVHVGTREQAERLKFPGSPTVRINGEDIEPDAPVEGFNLECRIYWANGRAIGSPPPEWIVRAVRAAI